MGGKERWLPKPCLLLGVMAVILYASLCHTLVVTMDVLICDCTSCSGDCVLELLFVPVVQITHLILPLREHVLDGIEVGRVRREEVQLKGTILREQLSHCC